MACDDNTLERNLLPTINAAAVSLVGEIAWNGLGYLSLIIIGRIFQAEGLGIFNILVVLLHVIGLVINVGFDVTSQRYLIYYFTKNDLSEFRGLSIFSPLIVFLNSIIWFVLLSIFSKELSILFFKDQDYQFALIVLATALPFYSLIAVFGKSLQSMRLVKYRIIVEKIVQPLILLAWIIFSYYLGKSIRFLIWGLSFAYFISFLILGYIYIMKVVSIAKNVPPRFPIKEWTASAIPIAFLALGIYLTTWISTLLVSIGLNPEEAGIYGASAKLIYLIALPPIAFEAMFLSQISSLFAEGNLIELRRQFMAVTRWISNLSMIIAGALFVLRRPLLLLFGAGFSLGEDILIILCISQVLYSIYGHLNGNLLVQTGNSKKDLFCVFITLLYQVILAIILMPSLGIVGAAISFGSAQIIFSFIRIIVTKNLFSINPLQVNILKPMLAVVLACIVCSFVPWPSGIFLSIMVCGLFYIVLVISLLGLLKFDPSDKELFLLLLARKFPKLFPSKL
jgi:O-antigen/teichoic acid export membrane protein